MHVPLEKPTWKMNCCLKSWTTSYCWKMMMSWSWSLMMMMSSTS
jgi:hypothetical protein